MSTVSPSAVLACLHASLQAATAAEATSALSAYERDPSFWPALLAIIAERANIDLSIRQAAALQFKNGIDKYWRKTAPNAIPREVKVAVRSQLTRLLATEASSVGKILEVCVGKMAKWDFDTEWATLPDELLQMLQAPPEQAPEAAQRSLGALSQTLKALTANRLPRGRKLTQQLCQRIFPSVAHAYTASLQDWLRNTTSASAERPLLISRLAMKNLHIILVYGWPDLTQSDPEVRTLLHTLVSDFDNVQRVRKVGLGQPASTLQGRLAGSYAKLWRALLAHAPQAAVALGLTPSLIDACWRLVEAAAADVEAIQDAKDAAYPQSLVVHAMLVLKLALSDWINEKPHPQASQLVQDAALLLITRILPLRLSELEAWAADAEEWANVNEADLDSLELRPAAYSLLKALAGRYSEVPPVIVRLLSDVHGMPADFQAVLAKEAVYNAMRLCSVQLADLVNFESFLGQTLAAEAAAHSADCRILRRAIGRLLGEWAGDETTAAARRNAYSVLVALISPAPGNDLAVRLAAVQALEVCVGNSWHFEEKDFLPYLNDAMGSLLELLKECELPESQLRVNAAIGTLVERMSEQIGPFALPLLHAMPPVWEAAGDNHLVRVGVLTTMKRLFEAVKERPDELIGAAASVIQSSCDPDQPHCVFLQEDGLELWSAVLKHSESLHPAIYQLLPALLRIIEGGTDALPLALRIFESYCLLAGPTVVETCAPRFLATAGVLLEGLKSEAARKLLHTICLVAASASSHIWGPPLQASGCVGKLLQPLLEPKAEALTVTKHLTVLARLCIMDVDVFLHVMDSVSAGASPAVALFLQRCFDRLDNMQIGQRKLVALSLAHLVGTARPDIVGRLADIFSFWLVPLAETEENSFGDSGAYHGDAAEAAGIEDDFSALGHVVGEDSPDRQRRVQLLERDPVHVVRLVDTVRDKLGLLEQAAGGAEQMRERYLAGIDPLIVDELGRRLRGELRGPNIFCADDLSASLGCFETMAKSKNASQHNQTRKAHKNGIHRPHKHRYAGMKGSDPKYRRNQRHAARGTQKALKAKRSEAASS